MGQALLLRVRHLLWGCKETPTANWGHSYETTPGAGYLSASVLIKASRRCEPGFKYCLTVSEIWGLSFFFWLPLVGNGWFKSWHPREGSWPWVPHRVMQVLAVQTSLTTLFVQLWKNTTAQNQLLDWPLEAEEYVICGLFVFRSELRTNSLDTIKS